ncbi:MAG: replicative DNA helicase [Candidatus Doudnabacteria bacterium RIFCSPHIGHO2_01_52_17]|uniref:Replicative DNA helicase n=1 Tax=Candidatus Doudnabacteria bacterium RIFCSPHIGHO2_01_52_17 TaxID=1817820 RepID=A0A1F5NBC6_9BACT|nr:MAG: replicative DNA helicase [Candidatus Doudnabacteria bacterium RIFCSPHIGHO2_01_52_17]
MAENKPNIDRLPPQNLEAEASVLGGIMLDRDAIIKVADILSAEDFYDRRNQMIFEVMMELYENRSSIDVLTVSNRLEEKGLMEQVGGMGYLTSLVNSTPTAAHVLHYSKIVQKKGTLRKLIHASSDIVSAAYGEAEDVDALLDTAEQKLFGVSQKYLKQNFIPLSDVLHETFDRIDELHKVRGKLRGLATGFVELDKYLGGLQKSDLIILAARPSMGKTSLALDIVRHVGVKEKVPVGVFSLEMSKDQLVDRLLAAEADVDLWRMRTGRLADDSEHNDFERIGHAMGRLADAPIFIDDSASSNIMEIRTKARRLQAEHDLGLIVVDYLQLMEGRNQENRVQEVSEISRALKSLARELNVPVLALSQLSRAVESRNPPIPQLSDLRESGSIEQDADVVMFIYREEQYKDKNSKKQHIADILIKKHRNGPTGSVELYFDANKTSFRNLSREQVEVVEEIEEI